MTKSNLKAIENVMVDMLGFEPAYSNKSFFVRLQKTDRRINEKYFTGRVLQVYMPNEDSLWDNKDKFVMVIYEHGDNYSNYYREDLKKHFDNFVDVVLELNNPYYKKLIKGDIPLWIT